MTPKQSWVLVIAIFTAWLWIVPPSGVWRLPRIPKHHWIRSDVGATLYDERGKLTASVVASNLWDTAQACVFDSSGPCEQFDSTNGAVEFVRSKYIDDSEDW